MVHNLSNVQGIKLNKSSRQPEEQIATSKKAKITSQSEQDIFQRIGKDIITQSENPSKIKTKFEKHKKASVNKMKAQGLKCRNIHCLDPNPVSFSFRSNLCRRCDQYYKRNKKLPETFRRCDHEQRNKKTSVNYNKTVTEKPFVCYNTTITENPPLDYTPELLNKIYQIVNENVSHNVSTKINHQIYKLFQKYVIVAQRPADFTEELLVYDEEAGSVVPLVKYPETIETEAPFQPSIEMEKSPFLSDEGALSIFSPVIENPQPLIAAGTSLPTFNMSENPFINLCKPELSVFLPDLE